MSKGRGGQPPKAIAMRTPGGWEQEFTEKVANEVKAALERCNAPETLFVPAFTIMRSYRDTMATFDAPSMSMVRNTEGRGLGHFAEQLRKRATKMANQLHESLDDELSYDLAGLTQGDLRSFMEETMRSLWDIANMIECRDQGITDFPSRAEIKKETGKRLKALAIQENLNLTVFIGAFGIHDATSGESLAKWIQRLNG